MATTPAIKVVDERPEAGWRPARLIPTTGIGGQEEQEQRATSSLLAVMRAVPDFGRALIAPLAAPAGRISTFTEVRFPVGEEKVVIPDGAIVVERGKTRWVCLVEVKTGNAPLRVEQVSSYLDAARVEGINAVLTISNQITADPHESPLTVDVRKLKKVSLWHLSWWRILTEAITQSRHRRISDPDQAWILEELIAYLDNEKSGAGGFEDMGERWVPVRDAVRAQTLRANDPGVREVAERWEQFVEYVALGMQQDLGQDVSPVWAVKGDIAARRDANIKDLVGSGRLQAGLRIPNAAAQLRLDVDLRTRQVTTSLDLPAPKEGKARTRIGWLMRQLREVPPGLRIDASFPSVRDTTSELHKVLLDKPDRLLWATDPTREPKAFRVAWAREMGTKRGKGKGSFVAESKHQVLDFYRTVLQQLKPWQPPAPKLPSAPDASSAEASPRPPDFSAPDTRDPGEGLDPED